MKRGYRHRVRRLWYFSIYAQELCAQRLSFLDVKPEQLIRFYLDDCLHIEMKKDFRQWLKAHKISV